ncbi:hypothetical protein HYFRA_00007175 [Hymenoscyphus fraxineus]|uniref:NACHT domain-containing protein n=1 Tax=Hymenoscyphus fraxineus TaxID=746836 RepID=A0A9N9PIZ3_9HELO|nr:hypothetical protein HYFRA_00007175 [Hymenoscyphus fraxineus]
MDPFTAIGLASNIISFLDYGVKTIHSAREIYDSSTGMTEKSSHLESIATKMKQFASNLVAPENSAKDQSENDLCDLALECRLISMKIIKLLEKLKARDSNSKFQSLIAGVKTKYRGSEMKIQLKDLVRLSEADSSKLQRLQKQMESLKNGATITSFSSETQTQLKGLLGVSESACEVIFQQRILNSLAFDGMSRRFNSVPEAHQETFRWIFEADGGKDKIFDHPGPRSFRSWLSSDEGTFHISGKLGSGKSTLMKFLCDHESTQTGLKKWAGDRRLVLAKFFFWKPGSLLQKSLEGLYRSLLHDILRSCPEFIPDVLPVRWKEVKSMPLQVQTQLDIGAREAKEAFTRLLSHMTLYKNHCFCYFVDGLDEYEETTEDDYKSMVETLARWTDLSHGGVKICISSREYNVFLNAFSGERRIRLQDLTKRDMLRYVRERLHSTGDEKSERIVNKIVEKGNGIFMWVSLVVKNFRACFEDSHELSELEKLLDTPLEELNNLFSHLLGSLEQSYRKRAALLFAMTETARRGLGLSPMCCSFLDDFDEDPLFATRNPYRHFNMNFIEKEKREAHAMKRINGYCKGLLEFEDNGVSMFLSYTHRSIPEFLRTRDFAGDTSFNLEGIVVEEVICQLLLGEIRTTAPHSISNQQMSKYAFTIVEMSSRCNMNQFPFLLLETLGMAVKLHEIVIDSDDRYKPRAIVRCHNNYESLEWILFGYIEGYIKDLQDHRGFAITNPVHLAASAGETNYVRWKLESDPSILASHYLTGLLICCSRSSSQLYLHEDILRLGVSPEAMIHKTWGSSDFRDEMSYWVHFFCKILCSFLPDIDDNGRKALGKCIEAFLRHGANPCLSAFISKKKSGDRNLPQSKANQTLNIKYDNKVFQALDDDGFRNSRLRDIRTDLRAKGGKWKSFAIGGEEIGFRELVLHFQFDNEATILQLIDAYNLKNPKEESREMPDMEETREPHEEEKTSEFPSQRQNQTEPTNSKIADVKHKNPALDHACSETLTTRRTWILFIALLLGMTSAIVMAWLFYH